MRKKLIIALLLIIISLVGYRVWLEREKPSPQTDNQTNSSNSPAAKPSFDKKKYSLTEPSSIWVIASKPRPLNPTTYAPSDLVEVGNGQQLRKQAAEAFSKMLAAARKSKLEILPLSGYRSYETQVSTYNNEVRRYGKAIADMQSARPGHSEHQTGLAIDVGGGGCGIEDCFGNTAEGKWIAANGYKYGFIVRYTPGKEAITGYRAEPWHIRYVGVDLAAEMQRTKIQTLEEFFDVVEKIPY